MWVEGEPLLRHCSGCCRQTSRDKRWFCWQRKRLVVRRITAEGEGRSENFREKMFYMLMEEEKKHLMNSQ